MKLWLLFRIELIRGFWQMKRYPFDTVIGFIGLGTIFFLLLGAGRVVSGAAPSAEGISNLILTYVLGFLVLSEISAPSQNISQESRSGTLEQLYMSGHRLPIILIARALASIASSLVFMTILLLSLLFLTSTKLEFSVWMLPPLFCMTTSALGLGFIFGAVALLVKKIDSIFFFVQLLMFALTSSAAPSVWWQYLIPIAPAAGLVRAIATGTNPPLEALLWVLVNAAAWLLFGIVMFQLALRMAQQRGLLGHE